MIKVVRPRRFVREAALRVTLLTLMPALAAPAAAASARPPAAVSASVPAAVAASVKVPARSTGQWWFDAWRVKDMWAAGATGQGVTVAVVDSGVNAERPELAGRMLRGNDFGGGPDWRDGDMPAHGSAIAILIAGRGGGSFSFTGVAPDAKILPVRFSLRNFDAGLRWAVDHGAKIINVSQGVDNPCTDGTLDAIRYVVDRGGVVVVSAGNEGDKPRVAKYPASCAGVLTVGAVDAALRTWPLTSPGEWVDVAALGTDVPHENIRGTLYNGSGTSASAALTSAAIADVWSKYPELTNRQVVARILATVKDDATRKGRDDWAGAGVVRPYEAVTAKVPLDAPNPVFDELDRVRPPAAATPSPDPAASSSSGGAVAAPPVRPGSEGEPGSSVGSENDPATGWQRELLLGLGTVLVAVLILVLLAVVVLRRRLSR